MARLALVHLVSLELAALRPCQRWASLVLTSELKAHLSLVASHCRGQQLANKEEAMKQRKENEKNIYNSKM